MASSTASGVLRWSSCAAWMSSGRIARRWDLSSIAAALRQFLRCGVRIRAVADSHQSPARCNVHPSHAMHQAAANSIFLPKAAVGPAILWRRDGRKWGRLANEWKREVSAVNHSVAKPKCFDIDQNLLFHCSGGLGVVTMNWFGFRPYPFHG